MNFSLGLKTDPINTRYSFPWLFDILAEEEIRFIQIGSFFELYDLEEGWFENIRSEANQRGLVLQSLFTAHRELGGFFYGDPYLERAARRACERFLKVASLLGVTHCGWNPGAVHRDRMETKSAGLACFHRHLEELTGMAHDLGLSAITLEPMSCLAEPPSTPDEISAMMERCAAHHRAYADSTAPVYLCGDVSHGVADAHHHVLHGNMELFEYSLPWMGEFHFKNTDPLFNSTFGFSPDEQKRGIVRLQEIREILERNAHRWPVNELIGYLEIGGPKIGRDYSDLLLADQLRTSLRALKEVFPLKPATVERS